MDTGQELTMQVVEVLHYSSDVDAAIEFYNTKLGWPVIWQSPGNMAVIDAGGAYQLTVVAAKWTTDWTPGAPVPTPKLALESKDLAADKAVLEARGMVGLEIGGDPATMLSMDIIDPQGIELFVWEDSAEAGATKVVEDYKAGRQPAARYSLGECLFFVDDMDTAEAFYQERLGFSVHNRHGKAFTGLRRDGGPILGLYYWPMWWEQPDEDAPESRVRLFLECPDIDAEHKRMKAAGAVPGDLHVNASGLRWFTLTDPDGNAITFWRFTPAA